MRDKFILAIRILATLLAAELVLVASLFINQNQANLNLIPTISIAYDSAPGNDTLDAAGSDPSALTDQDLHERQTGEALMDQEAAQTTVSPGTTQEGYPAPLETLIDATPLVTDEYLPPPGDPWDEWNGNGGGNEYQPPPLDTTEPEPSNTPRPSPHPTNPSQPTASPTLSPKATTSPRSSPTPGAGSPTAQPTAAGDGLVSVHVESAPKLDGKASDESWQTAPSLVVSAQGGVNASATQVTLRSVYNGKRIYFLLTWADPTHSQLYQPWEKQKDGSWKRVSGADNAGGDENEFAEDKISLMWPATSRAIKDFLTQGCAIACHSGENPDTKPYGNTYLPQEGEIADLWVWKSVRDVAQVDDLYLDSTRYADDQRAAGRKSDPSDGGGYHNNGGDAPEFMLPGDGIDGLPGFILDSEKEKLENDRYKAGDRLPAFLTSPFEGDRGDISAAWHFSNGAWTLELSRRLETGSKYDVQFSDLSQAYYFSLAVFDNTQVRHAYHEGVITLHFQK
jgi:hypothetical protein